MKKSELIHWRLQAMLREHSFSDLKYIGVKPDSIGMPQHWYMIGDHEVSCDSTSTSNDAEELIDKVTKLAKVSAFNN